MSRKNRVASIVISIILGLSTFVLAGCNTNIISENDIWVFRRLTNTQDEDRIVLVSVIDVFATTDEDGAMIIPTEIDGFRVVLLGDFSRSYPGIAFFDAQPFHTGRGRVNKIVVPQRSIFGGD